MNLNDHQASTVDGISLHARMRYAYGYDLIVITFGDLVRISQARDSHAMLRELLLAKVDVSRITPFTIHGPVEDSVFFGRERELRLITDNAGQKSFCIIGGRRIGKSSLLGRLHRIQLSSSGFRSIYVDCSIAPSYQQFLALMIQDWRPAPPHNPPLTLGELLISPPRDKPLVILLDEADKLVSIDSSIQPSRWPLFNTLRAFNNNGFGHFVLGGERGLRESLRDPFSPLFNFANELWLGPLDFHSASELVTRPLAQLNIAIEETRTVIQHIYDFSSGHPNIIQRLCQRLVEIINTQNSRLVTVDTVNMVTNDPKFQEDDFLAVYWEQATPLEMIISLLMAQETNRYRLGKIINLLAENEFHPDPIVVKSALDRLVDFRNILRRTQAGYEFAVTAFPRVIANTTTAEDLLIVLRSQYLKNPMELME